MNFIERVMRVMTHINIGTSLGLATWVLWSGWQVVTGQLSPAYRVDEVKALMRQAPAGDPAPTPLLPVQAGTRAMPPCPCAAAAPTRAALVVSGADL